MKNLKIFIKDNSLALLLIFAYILLLAPYSLNYIFYMPDERHYVDAAIYMLKHGDYLSPHNPDGGFRFLKPIFTYWVVLSSYVIFGISEFSSRFPFLLAAGMVLWLTYRTTLLAFKNKETAILSVIILGATPILHRSTPLTLTDLLLLIFLQVMIWGVIGLLVSNIKKSGYLWAIYIGAGMAVMTKGLPAVAFLMVALFFLLVNPWRRFRLKEILHFPSLIIGLVLGSFWYVAIYQQHGSEAIASFVEDQVGIRVAEKIGLIAVNFFSSVLVIILIMFPLMLPGWRSLFYRHSEINQNKQIKSILGFSVLWVLAMIGMASLVSKFYYRYLVPVIPVMAMVMAYFIWSQQSKKGTKRLLKTALIIAYAIFILVNIAGIASAILFMAPKWYFAVFVISIGISSWYFTKWINEILLKQSTLTYLLMAGIFFGLFFVIKPISYPGEGKQIAEKLQELKIKNTDAIQFYGKTRSASRLRVATKGEFYLKAWQPYQSQILPETEVVIIADTYLDSLALDDFKIYPASAVWGDIRVDEIYQAKTEKELNELKFKRSDLYFIGIREE
ncbi:ArnT family glycosyltransferase [Sunxiuqinia sp. A32]|uniref:ArnT family glycosyltransferase n=1 Tax=Sunxiuqinia sp. A32 TaxID=3461496 RepID=UPI0040467EB1